ncbi:MAG: sugar ABC transporter permease [Microbacteriaceae bacterium]|nr:sugar ABC transporter permease [Microbacteriaceae bacterium]
MTTHASTSPAPARGRRQSLGRRHALAGFFFIAPTFILLLAFVIGPAVGAIYLSTTQWYLVGSPTFVGLKNYIDLLADSAFGQALVVTFQVAFGVAIPGAVLALILGLMLTRVRRGRSFYQTLVYTPLVVPSVVASIIWGGMYVGNGVINSLFGVHVSWLADPQVAVFAILMMMVWTNVGYYTILLYAGLEDIPGEVVEAASVDGANAVQRLRYIILPLLRPVLLFVIVVATVDALTLFVQPYLLTQGGPGRATQTLSLYIYQTAFSFGNVGRASAMAVVLLAIAMLFAFAQFRLLRSNDD